jgi:hypothetical protein
VDPGGEIRRVAAALRTRASALLRERVRRGNGDDKAGAKQANEVAALELEDVAPPFGQFISFYF